MPSTLNPKTIHLSPEEIRIQKEGKAVSTITPGQFIERVAGTVDGVRRHTTDGGVAQLSVALENDMVGLTIDDDYLTGDRVLYCVVSNGEEVYSLLANGQNAEENDFLSVVGGNLRVAQPGDHIVAQAREAVNNSGGSSPARIKVETLIAVAPAS